jgi:transposase
MAEGDIIMMRQEELKRLHLIRQVIEKVLTQIEAGNLLSLSTRQIRRIAKRVLKEGDKGVIHKSRGHPSPNAIEEDIKAKALQLCTTKYEGFNPTLAAEKLFEINGIEISRETLRTWFKENDIPYQTRKKRPHRNWRERRHHFGAMEQVDGSHHDWFENRGPKCVLMGYIDDANNNVFARFYDSEGTFPFMDSFKRYIRKYGLPQSVYIDRHAAYKVNREPSIEDQLNNREPESQVQRALGELGVEPIFAHSAPAKGRIERLFRTFQDRLVKEMRLKGVKSVQEGNKILKDYLPVYNKRFMVEALEKGNLHRPLPKGINLDKILCRKTEHPLNNDSTILHDKKLYHILNKVYAKKVMVEERIDGRLLITYKDKELKYRLIIQRPIKKSEPVRQQAYIATKAHKPAADHPWNRLILKRYPHSNNYSQREKGSQKEKELLLVHS